MAVYNEILVGRLNRALQKFLGIKGTVPAPQIASEFMSVFPFFWGAEMRYLESWFKFGLMFSVAGVASVFSQVRLRNPTGSNIVIVMEKMTWMNTTGADQPLLTMGPTSADLATIASVTTARFDPRGNPQPTAIISGTAAAISNLASNKAQLALSGVNTFADFITTDFQEFPVLPGDGIQISGNNANQTIFATLWWRERFLEESERT